MAASAAMAVMAASQFAGASAEARALEAQGDFQKAQSEQNARLAEAQAAEIEAQGKKEAGLFRRKVRGKIGAQRAALAAQGIDVGVGTAQDLQIETANFGEDDAATIRRNAIRQAYGYRVEGIQGRTQGAMDSIAAQSRASATLATGGLQAANTIFSGVDSGYFTNKPKTTKTTKTRTTSGTPVSRRIRNTA